MKPNNAHFIADAHDSRLTLGDIRARWRSGEYGKVRTEYAQGWLTLANRTPQPAPKPVQLDLEQEV